MRKHLAQVWRSTPFGCFFCFMNTNTLSTRTQEFSQFLADLEMFETKVWNEHQKMYEDCGFDTAVDAMREAMQYLICVSIMEDAQSAYESKLTKCT